MPCQEEKTADSSITALRSYSGRIFTQTEMDQLLAGMFPNPNEGKKSRKTILEACAISAYQDSKEAIPILRAQSKITYPT